jgi:hypothetical protein
MLGGLLSLLLLLALVLFDRSTCPIAHSNFLVLVRAPNASVPSRRGEST